MVCEFEIKNSEYKQLRGYFAHMIFPWKGQSFTIYNWFDSAIFERVWSLAYELNGDVKIISMRHSKLPIPVPDYFIKQLEILTMSNRINY